MLTTILLGLTWCVNLVRKHWKIALIVLGLGLLLLFVALTFSKCGQPKPIDEKKVQEAITAIEQKNYDRLKEKMVELAVDEKAIDTNVANGRKDSLEAANAEREKLKNMDAEQLKAEFCKRYGGC